MAHFLQEYIPPTALAYEQEVGASRVQVAGFGLAPGQDGGKGTGMGVAEIMREVRKLPDDKLMALAAQVDAEAARAVDHQFECLVRDGQFADLAAAALREQKEDTTKPLHEILECDS